MPKPSIRHIGDLMTGDLLTLGPQETMERASELLAATGLHAIPIVEHDEALGMVTLADCQGRSPDDALGEIMAGPPISIDYTESVAEAAAMMRSHYVHHLIVTEGDRREVVGLLSSYDLLAMLVD
ncbi:MAG: CBS domain-containing protein [Acidimicrobiia bacterium]|nr:CBS domain-containing protein [Acidimicrobiia bacterium]